MGDPGRGFRSEPVEPKDGLDDVLEEDGVDNGRARDEIARRDLL